MTAQRVGEANGFIYGGPHLGGANIIETQIIQTGSDGVKLVYGGAGNSAFIMPWTQATKNGSPIGTQLVPGICRFPHVLADNRGAYCLFGGDGDSGGDLRLWMTGDPSLLSWPQNAGLMVLQRVSGVLDVVFNAAPAFVGNDLCALIEVPQGLIYSRVPWNSGAPNLNEGLTIVSGAPVLVIPGGGNAHLTLTPSGKHFVAWHGMRDDRFGGSFWYLTASTCAVDDAHDPAAWTTHRDTFALGQNGCHIADPCVFDGPDGNSEMLFSYTTPHNSVTKLRSLSRWRSFTELADLLTR